MKFDVSEIKSTDQIVISLKTEGDDNKVTVVGSAQFLLDSDKTKENSDLFVVSLKNVDKEIGKCDV